MNFVKAVLFASLILAISGCNDYPGGVDKRIGSYEVIKNSNKLVNLDNFETTNTCHIDSINDQSGEKNGMHDINKNKSFLNVSGWISSPVNKNTEVRGNSLLQLKSVTNTYQFRLSDVDRPDVAEFFKNSAFKNSGFNGSMDINDIISGSYELSIFLDNKNSIIKCAYGALININ